MNEEPTFANVTFWVSIQVFKGRDSIERLYWNDMRLDTRNRYGWYFNYRAALLQVKYPKYRIEYHWGNEPAVGKSKIEYIKSRISAKKRTISKYNNIINNARANWNELFPIEEHELYIKGIAKIERLKNELIEIETELTNQKSTQ